MSFTYIVYDITEALIMLTLKLRIKDLAHSIIKCMEVSVILQMVGNTEFIHHVIRFPARLVRGRAGENDATVAAPWSLKCDEWTRGTGAVHSRPQEVHTNEGHHYATANEVGNGLCPLVTSVHSPPKLRSRQPMGP